MHEQEIKILDDAEIKKFKIEEIDLDNLYNRIIYKYKDNPLLTQKIHKPFFNSFFQSGKLVEFQPFNLNKLHSLREFFIVDSYIILFTHFNREVFVKIQNLKMKNISQSSSIKSNIYSSSFGICKLTNRLIN